MLWIQTICNSLHIQRGSASTYLQEPGILYGLYLSGDLILLWFGHDCFFQLFSELLVAITHFNIVPNCLFWNSCGISHMSAYASLRFCLKLMIWSESCGVWRFLFAAFSPASINSVTDRPVSYVTVEMRGTKIPQIWKTIPKPRISEPEHQSRLVQLLAIKNRNYVLLQ